MLALHRSEIAAPGEQYRKSISCIVTSALLSLLACVGFSQESLTLSAAIEEAARHSPQARAALYERDAAHALTDHDKPTLHPTLHATASGTAQGPRVAFPLPISSDRTIVPEETGRLDFVFEMPLYHAGSRAARERYGAQSAQAEIDYRKSLLEIASNIERLFLEHYRAESGLRVAQEGVQAAVKYQDLVQHLIASGSGKPVDLQTAESQVAEARAGLLKAENGQITALMAINQALGRPIQKPLTIAYRPGQVSIPESPDPYIKRAIGTRLEIQTLRLSISAARAGVSLAKSQSQPGVIARGQLTEQTPTAFLHEHYAAATIEINLPILDNGKAHLDAREAAAQVNRLEALQEQTASGIELDVRSAWLNIKQAAAQVSLAEIQVNGAAKAAAVAETAYSVGRATAVDVQAAQREVRLAKEKQIQAALDLLAAQCEFNRATGIVPPVVDSIAPLPGEARSK